MWPLKLSVDITSDPNCDQLSSNRAGGTTQATFGEGRRLHAKIAMPRCRTVLCDHFLTFQLRRCAQQMKLTEMLLRGWSWQVRGSRVRS
jgi:hypothetical protein